MKIQIGKITASSDNPIVLAEAGVNHNGSLLKAEKLIKTAARGGAKIVKFQTYKASKLVTRKSPRFWKWSGEKKKYGSQFDTYSTLDSFNVEQYSILKKMCDKYKVEFMSTPFDDESAIMLNRLGMKAFKVASCDITNYPLLKTISKFNKPILLSTGASDISEIKETVKFLESQNVKKLCIMHCILSYPTKLENANLKAILDIKRNFPNYLLGLSDHTLGIETAVSSIMYDVAIIEKHYTYNKNLKKSADHWLSLNEKEINQLVNRIKIQKIIKGTESKKRLKCEKITHKFARRSLVAKYDLPEGHKITYDDMIPKRPGTGISPKYFEKLIGKKLKVKVKEDELFNFKKFY